ncbi:MAG: hypothetical protein MJZ34_14405, partial [Paludibacteraceae bacterium]|nr:hypothetical protein [Paludibacteraceae bacterium]
MKEFIFNSDYPDLDVRDNGKLLPICLYEHTKDAQELDRSMHILREFQDWDEPPPSLPEKYHNNIMINNTVYAVIQRLQQYDDIFSRRTIAELKRYLDPCESLDYC